MMTTGDFYIKSAISPIEMLLQIIINKYLNNSYCLTYVSQVEMNIQIPYTFTNIATNGTDVDELVNQMMNVVEMGCSDYVVRIKNPGIFVGSFDKVNHLANMRRSDKKIVMLPYADDDYSVEGLMSVLSMRQSSFVANLLLVVPDIPNIKNCVSYNLITHNFVGAEADTNKPRYLDRWDCTYKFEKEANLFPHTEVADMHGKTIKLACFTYKPYVLLDLDSSIVPSERDGTEVRIVEEFCRWLNCSIKLIRADEEQWGEIYENGTGSGVLGNVVEDRADLGITALYSWFEEFLYLDFSCSSIRTGVRCIAPAPNLLVSWEMPLLPFSWNMWIGVILTFIFSALALIIAQGCSSDHEFLLSFGILTGQSHDDTRPSWRTRRVTAWLILGTLILTNAYGAGLASTFTVPKYEKAIDTIQDIIDTNTEWGATHDAWIFSLSLSPEPQIKQLVKQFKIHSFEELKAKSFSRSMAYSVEKLPSGTFAIGEYITKEVVRGYRLMKEDFYYEQNVVMLRKSSPYTQKMNTLIGRLHESGLLLAWESRVALQHLDYNVQLEVKTSHSKKEVEIVPLSFRHIVGIFYMFGIGMALSIVLFLIEIISKKKLE